MNHGKTHDDMQPGDTVDWNPTGDTWLRATVTGLDNTHAVIQLLDSTRQTVTVDRRHLRFA